MARYYRRRYRTIVRAPKKKWASNINRFKEVTQVTGTSAGFTVTLVTNATQSSSPTPVIVKTGNFKVQGDASMSVTSVPSGTTATVPLSLYILYIPEGITASNYAQISGIVNAHPEWILAWKYISSNAAVTGGVNDEDTFSFRSRLKRNLNSGDSIILAGLVEVNSVQGTLTVSGMAQYWTCAN